MKLKMGWQPRPAWADELDFAGPQVRPALWAWGLLLAGLVALATVMPWVEQAEADRHDAELAIKRLQRAAHQHALTVKARSQSQTERAVGGMAATSSGLSPDQARRALALAASLAYPWQDMLAQADLAAEANHVLLMKFSVNLAAAGDQPGAAPEIKLMGAVKDDAHALRWAQAHGPKAQLLSREPMNTPIDTAGGTYSWLAQAVWRGGSP